MGQCQPFGHIDHAVDATLGFGVGVGWGGASGHVDHAVEATLGLGWVGGSHVHAK